ncbi:MAG: hypothetical protein GY757_56635, partial [bacterium]|nr:hypothetical protein [bacterium]
MNRLFKLFIMLFLITGIGLYGADSRDNTVTATYCDDSTVEMYPYSYVTRGDSSTFNCYDVQVLPIYQGRMYSFEDGEDGDYDDVVIRVWTTGKYTGNPVAHVKFMSVSASYKHWIHLVIDGADQLAFKCEDVVSHYIYDIPLAARACPDFTIAAAPASRNVVQGSSVDYIVTLTAVGGFDENVDLSVTGLPANATGTFSPDPAAVSGTSTLTVTTTGATPVGSYNLSITGSGGDETHSTPVTLVVETDGGNPPDYTIEATPGQQSVTPGEKTNFTVTLTPVNGFTGAVDLKLYGLPAGAESTIQPNPVTVAGTTQSTIKITATAETPAGTYALNLAANGNGIAHSTEITLIIEEPADFSIEATPRQGEVVQGESIDYSITLTALNGFSADVDLAVTGLPTGASGNFSIDPVTLSSTATSKLTVATGEDTPQGTYLLTITGQGGGVSQQLQVSLTVNPKPDFDLTATPTKREIFPGETTTFQINSEILNQFHGSIQLEVTNLPGHTRGQFLPAALHAGAISTPTVTTPTAAPLGANALPVKGTS